MKVLEIKGKPWSTLLQSRVGHWQANQIYYSNLGDNLPDPSTVQKNVWTAFWSIANKRKHVNIPQLIENDNYVSTFLKGPIYLTIFFSINAKFMVTEVPYLELQRRGMR